MPFFDYELPERLIAQQPAARRDESRLLVVRRSTGELEHRVFRDLPGLLHPATCCLNDTKVLPARLLGHRREDRRQVGGPLPPQRTADGLWEMLAKTRGHPTGGEWFAVDSGSAARSHGRTDDHHWL